MKYYIRYQIQYSLIFQILEKLNKKKINFFIDLLNISRGLYNRKVVEHEILYYMEAKQPPKTFIDELRNFCNNLYIRFRHYDPYFIIFYDDGICQQNKSILKSYKYGRSKLSNDYFQSDADKEIHDLIVKYYYNYIFNYFNDKKRENVSRVFYLKNYESDLIPHYCIIKNLFDSAEKDILNVILSIDKDLLQTTRFPNTIVYASKFLPSINKLSFGVYDRITAFQYLYSKAKIGGLTAEYIPLFLSIAGDAADGISGIKNYGPAKTYHLLTNTKINWDFTKVDRNTLPDFFKKHYEQIYKNFLVISFDEQIKRIKNINGLY